MQLLLLLRRSSNAADDGRKLSPPAATTTASTQASTPAGTAAPANTAVLNDGRIFASPLAKKIAQEKGIDLKYVKGTGENGRITRADLNNYTPGSVAPAASPASASALQYLFHQVL
jgi:pyruvate dehydrogenase E2 component (dihydrolipoamide acetyltransferase)